MGENRGKNGRILTPPPTNSILLFGFQSTLRREVSSKLSENCDRKRDDRQTDRQTHTDAGDSIICPMLCYSNGKDNYITICNKVWPITDIQNTGLSNLWTI